MFGSHVKKKARKDSDIDLLIVMKNLPNNWRNRKNIITLIEKFFTKPLDIILMTPKELKSSIKSYNPLMLSILENYYVIIGKNFFEEIVDLYNKIKIENGIKKIGKFSWKIESLVESHGS